MNKNIIFVGLVLLVLLASGCSSIKEEQKLIGGDKDEGGCLIGAGYSWCEAKQKCLRIWEEPCEDAIACTADAKICDDGSAVGRTGPNCEFAPCPGEESGEQCAKEGQYTAQNACCEGLEEFDTGTEMGSLCYNTSKGMPVCKAIGTRSEGWYYPAPQSLLRYDKCSGSIAPTTETKEGIVVKQSGGAAMLIMECSDREYVSNSSDYILEGTVEKAESRWNEEHTSIITYTDFAIDKYIKGEPFAEDKLQIQTPGGTVGDIGMAVEDQPIFHEGKKVRIYFEENNGAFSIVCSQMGVEEI